MNVGQQARIILESTFDNVFNNTLIYVNPEGLSYVFSCISHDEVLRNRRERLGIENEEAVLDRLSKRVILKTNDLIAKGLSVLDAAGYILMDGVRYDFSVTEPFNNDDITPFRGAERTFSVYYLRRAQELESQVAEITEGSFSFGDWKLQQ